MLSIPALQNVARAKRQQIAVGISIMVVSMLSAFVIVGPFRGPAWMIFVCMLVGILLALIVCFRMFIRWRLRAYDETQNIRQLHLIAQLSDMVSHPQLEPFLQALSSSAETKRWKALLESATTAPFNPFPGSPPPERPIGYSSQGQRIGLAIALVGLASLIAVQLQAFKKASSTQLLLAGVTLFFAVRAIRRMRTNGPALVLNAQGLYFPEKNRQLFWNEISEERLEKINVGKSRIYKLRFRYAGQEESYPVEELSIFPGELRYLLLWYRHAYEAGT